ncbi:MAG: glycosyltransferase family 39 protein [Candidatus Methanoperedens sp.]|nr:glycosyltransferase family 39 protein [Candidatus Methanoperedens sp.]
MFKIDNHKIQRKYIKPENVTYAVAIIILCSIQFLYLFRYYYTGSDDGTRFISAMSLLNGDLPYSKFYTIYPPGLEVLLAGVYVILGKSLETSVSILFIFNLLTAFIIFIIGRKIANFEAGVLSSILFLAGILLYDGTQVLLENFVVFFDSAGLLLILTYEEKKDLRYAFLSGLLIGIGILFKQVGIFIIAALLSYYLIGFLASKQNLKASLNGLIKKAFVILAGFSLPILVTIVFFWKNNLLDKFLYSNIFVILNGDYPFFLQGFINNTYNNFLIFPALWVITLISIIRVISKRSFSRQSPMVLLIIWLFLILISTLKRQYPHYYLLLLPSASILSSVTISNVMQFLSKKKALSFFLVILILGLAFMPVFISFDKVTKLKGDYLIKQELVAEYINAHTKPEDKILIFGCAPGLYFLSDRMPATRVLCNIDPKISDTHYSATDLINDMIKNNESYVITIDNVGDYYKEAYIYLEQNYEVERQFFVRQDFNLIKIFRPKTAIETPPHKSLSIASFEYPEVWSSGVKDCQNKKEGNCSLSISSYGSWSTTTRNVNLDLSNNSIDSDSIDIWIYIRNSSAVDQIGFSFKNNELNRKFFYFTSDFEEGWAKYRLTKISFYTEGSGSWKDIKTLEVSFKAKDGSYAAIALDDWRLIK